jgi:hypothetical protein
MTAYEYRLLTRAHKRIAKSLGCDFGNFGWVVAGSTICSKTSKGYLTTARLGVSRYASALEPYSGL